MISATTRVAIAITIVLGNTPDIARACSVCSRGDPLAPAAEGHGQGGDLRLALDAEILSQRSATPGVATMHDDLDEYTLKLTGVYSPAPPVNLVVSVPFTRKRMTMEHGGGVTFVASDLTGVGDVDVGGRWFFWESVNVRARLRHSVGISAGTSFPTGPSEPRTVAGLPNAQHEQLGTGAFGPYAGLSYRLQRDPFAALLSVSGRTHTANGEGYRYGSALLWTVQGQWTPMRWLAVGLGIDGHDGGRDRQDGTYVQSTGGLVLWASPSAYVNVYRRLWVTLRAQLPFHSSLVGDQSVGAVVVAGVQYAVF
jgi:hypothetical protein